MGIRRTFHFGILILAALSFAAFPGAAQEAEKPRLDDVLSAIVQVRSDVPADARTARTLGTRREGSGVLIDDDGLVLTIGYLILEASGAEVVFKGGRAVRAELVAYDHDTGFGLLRAPPPPGVRSLEMGNSAQAKSRDPVLIAAFGGRQAVSGAFIVSRRPFAGYWEYLLENALFTSPPHPAFGGAALVGEDGRLLGIGSLIVPDAAEPDVHFPGNMFVPIDALKPILGDLLAKGRSGRAPRPWLGVYTQELEGRLFVVRAPQSGPAYQAGVRAGDLVLAVDGKPVDGLADFYRRVWDLGKAGVTVPLTVLRKNAPMDFSVQSIDRLDWLKTRQSY